MNNQNNKSLSPPQVQREYEDSWNKLIIDLDALRTNYNYLKSQLPDSTRFYAVLKSDAYGHDLIESARILSGHGCRHFAVDTPQEGIRLRNEGIKGEILLMNPIPLWMAELSVRHDLSISVIHESILKPIEEAASQMNKTCRIHLNVNVGLHRMGIAPSRLIKIARKATSCKHIHQEGIFGQPRDPDSAMQSFNQLKTLYSRLKAENIAPDYLHFANSTTFLAQPETRTEGVRLGILLYGVLPPEQYTEEAKNEHLKPVMSLRTEIVQIRQLPAGSRIGYRSKEKTQKDLTIGTIPIGYNHGLDRKIFKGGYVLVHSQKVPFIGAISMNSSTIDITGIDDMEIGDEVIIIGRQGDHEININELALKSGTIAGELMMRFGKSIPRDYQLDGEDITSEIVLEQEKTDDIHIQYFQTENELPEWINVLDIVNFLYSNLAPCGDPKDVVYKVIDYALSTHPGGKGFILLASVEKKIIGAAVCIQSDKVDRTPENRIVYVGVNKDYRTNGLGTRLIREAMDIVNGDVKVIMKKDNPAVNLFKKLGFSDEYIELSHQKKD